MNHVLSKLNLKILTLFFFFFALSSCKKETTSVVDNPKMDAKIVFNGGITSLVDDPIMNAEIEFNRRIKNTQITDNGKSILNGDILMNREVNWSKSTFKTMGDSVIVFAPIHLPYSIIVEHNGDSVNMSDNLYLRIINTGNGWDKSKIEMIAVLNPPTYTQTTSNGFLIIEDWFNPIPRAKKIPNSNASGMMARYSCVTWSQTRCGGHESNLGCETVYFTDCSGGIGGGEPGSGGTPGNNEPYPAPEVGGGGNEPPTSQIKMSLSDREKYPVIAKVLDEIQYKVITDVNLMNTLKKYTNLSEAKILEYLTPGNGPQLTIELLDASTNGTVKGWPYRIVINSLYAERLNTLNLVDPKTFNLFIASTILHEFTHFVEHTTFIRFNNDPFGNDVGKQFENAYFGGDIDYNHATDELKLKKLPD